MKQALHILSILLLFTSCAKEDVKGTSAIPITDTSIINISYGPNVANQLDLYLPANRTAATKLVVVIHGGGWNAGDKNELSFIAVGLKARGFATANINYRLSPQSSDNYKMQLDDIALVINFLSQNSGKYTFSKQKIYITGHSAGAHLALSYAYTRSDDRIKAVAGMATPTNLYTGATQNFGIVGATTITPYLGAPLGPATEQLYKNASPFYHVNGNTVPTLLFQGMADIIVPQVQATSLDDELKRVNVPEKLILYPFISHDWWGNPDLVKNTLDETANWFSRY